MKELTLEEAFGAIVSDQKASISFLQRHFGIGYAAACRIMQELEIRGCVGPARGTEPRKIYNRKTVKTDAEVTEILRNELRNNGYRAAEPYEWHQGECLYHGEPIQGRATEGETAAIRATLEVI